MAMLAPKTPLTAGIGSSVSSSQLQAARDYSAAPGSRRTPLPDTSNHGTFASPTESEFSESFDGGDSVRSWDEKQVGEWLKSIGCGVYVNTFKDNNVNGSNLIECDQAVLKEMGIKKVGDRVRIFVGIKSLRTKSMPNQKKRNRDSIATLDGITLSSRLGGFENRRDQSAGGSDRLRSSQNTPSSSTFASKNPYHSPKMDGRSSLHIPGLPRRPDSPSEHTSAGSAQSKRRGESQGSRPAGKDLIKVISGSLTKTLDITGWKTFEDVMKITLRKMNRPDASARNFCFYVHEPSLEDANRCRRLAEKEAIEILSNPSNKLRQRFILRTIHSGEPDADEIQKSLDFAREGLRLEHQASYAKNNTKDEKLKRIFGESIELMRAPLSPAVPGGHNPLPNDSNRRSLLPPTSWTAPANDRDSMGSYSPPKRVDSKRQQPTRKFQGTRPPSELISHDLQSYFTDHKATDLERTMSMAQRRSARVSKALSRLSVASSFSVKDIMKDAPALPSLPANFLDYDPYANSGGMNGKPSRPLSVWRQSVALPSVKEDESDAKEPNRKSYISITSVEEEPSKTDTVIPSSSTDDDSSVKTYLDEGTLSSSGTGHNTLNEHYREALKADGEGPDEELDAFLTGNTFDNFSWMQGDLIGQGSFGSVYLALHAVTGELMAVKQVELPGKAGADAALEKRKESMLAALKREINLLSELQHEHIVQYLGVQATDEHLNIFLEYVPGGSVASMLNNYGHLHEPLIRNLVRQTLDGLTYLHKRDIIHRDIKGANILVDNKGKVKISDFGISKKVDLQSASSGSSGPPGKGANKRVSMQGSVFWMAPEVVKQTSYTRKADIWSLGALIVEMFTGEHPYPKLNQMQAIFRLGGHHNQKPEIPDNAGPDAKDFLNKTFEIDEAARPEAADLMRFAFVKATGT